jgi:hypothetical protein
MAKIQKQSKWGTAEACCWRRHGDRRLAGTAGLRKLK